MGKKRASPDPYSEKGVCIKRWRDRIPVCIVFPNSYYVGMSNLAVHLLYKILNDIPEIVCERAFFEEGEDIVSIESKRPLSSFECLFFSISFELDYINILKILRKSRIGILSKDRKEQDPLIIGGGIMVMANPEPLYKYFDLFLLGDVEAIIPDFIHYYMEKRGNKRSYIIDGAGIYDWIYNPHRLQIEYREDGQVESFKPMDFKVYLKRYRGERFGRSVILTENTEFSQMFLLEGTRGCPSMCGFCLLGNIYDFTFDTDFNIPDDIKDIGLIGGGVSFHPHLEDMVMEWTKKGINIHFPSLRIDMTPLSVIELVGKNIKTLTFGIEAGTEQLRAYLGKPIKDGEIFERISSIMEIKPFNLKLYFMIGIPDEKKEDIESIVELTKKIKHIMIKEGAKKGAVGSITIHVSPFVPKPATPFQRMPMEEPRLLKEKINYLKRALMKVDNTFFTHESVKYSFVQGVFARGDRRVADIINILSEGTNINKVMKESPVNLNFYALRKRSPQEVLPWDFIQKNH